MVGQLYNRTLIDTWLDRNVFPRFLIILGRRGSGRATLAKYVADKLKADVVDVEKGIDSIRSATALANTVVTSTIYLIKDADDLSTAAVNALLKAVEEPKYNAYFIMTLANTDNTLPTILSRATVISMSPYSETEFSEFTDDKRYFRLDLTPGSVINWSKRGDFHEFLQYCDNVANTLEKKSGVETLTLYKVVQVNTKELDEAKYPAEDFVNVISMLVLKRFVAVLDRQQVCNIVSLKNTTLLHLSSNYKKEPIIDGFLLSLRDIIKEIK